MVEMFLALIRGSLMKHVIGLSLIAALAMIVAIAIAVYVRHLI
jgi:hypothetical protein